MDVLLASLAVAISSDCKIRDPVHTQATYDCSQWCDILFEFLSLAVMCLYQVDGLAPRVEDGQQGVSECNHLVQVKGTSMLRLPGEDAIISWPNAKETIIDARDAYMARTIFAAATGEA